MTGNRKRFLKKRTKEDPSRMDNCRTSSWILCWTSGYNASKAIMKDKVCAVDADSTRVSDKLRLMKNLPVPAAKNTYQSLEFGFNSEN